jgi:ubiquinone/menaquinone biosynthesis C-methylase UbiE
MKPYDEVSYWRRREQPNAKGIEDSTAGHVAYIEKQLIGCNKILDCGPGDGRTFEAYKNMKIVNCVDVADHHRETLFKIAQQYDFEFDFLVKKEVGNWPYKDKEFDAAIACQLLLHQRPKNIVKMMSELVRVSNKVIVLSWMNEELPPLTTSGEHCFNYIYPDICNENGWRIYNIEKHARRNPQWGGIQIYFCYEEQK